MPTNKDICDDLVAAYRKADLAFQAAQLGPDIHRQHEFACIIGALQGAISLATIDLGMRGPIRLPKPEPLEQASRGERRMGSEKDYCDTDDVARSLDAEEKLR